MTRLTWMLTTALLLPLAAGARQIPPVPPAPPAPPSAPALPPPAPAPPALAPVPPVPPPPAVVAGPRRELQRLQVRMQELQQRLQSRRRLQLDDRTVRDLERELERVNEDILRLKDRPQGDMEIDARRMADEIRSHALDMQDDARRMAEDAVRLHEEDFRLIGEQAWLAAEDAWHMMEGPAGNGFMLQGPQPPQPPQPPNPPQGPRVVVRVPRMADGETDEGSIYNNGLNAVQQRQYDRAITLFDRVLAQKSTRADGALYWKAFAQARLVRVEDALATLATLRRDHPQSRYLNDAKVLEADARKMSGQRADPETLDANDEIKLLAINGIANTEPDRAIPLLEGVLNGNNTLGNKKRALYVLALNEDPRAHQILLRYAKGGGTPELQIEAVRYLSLRGDTTTRNAELRDIYESTQDPAVRRAIIDAFRRTGDKGFLLAIAKDKNTNVDLKRSAISGLGTMAPPAELWTLYQQEPDPELRNQMVGVFASLGAADQLLSIARTEKDANVRARAIRSLGSLGNEKTGAALVDLYGSDQDPNVRRAVMSALASQNNAEALVAIARKETSLDLKREIVRRLSDLAPKNKVAADYLMEVIK